MNEMIRHQAISMMDAGFNRERIADTCGVAVEDIDRIAADMIKAGEIDIPILLSLDYIRPIPSFPDYYAGRGGQIISTRRKGNPYLMRQFINSRYYCVKVRAVDRGVVRFVHSLVASAYHGPRPSPKHETRHLDGNNFNNMPTNLKWGTSAENTADMIRHGRTGHLLQPGEENATHKLTEAQVLDMFQRHAAGEMCKLIAQRYGISKAHLSNILNGKRWKHLQPKVAA